MTAVLDPPKARRDPPTEEEPAGGNAAAAPLVAAPEPAPGRGGRGVYRAGEWRGTAWPIVVPATGMQIDEFLDWVASDEFPAGLKASLINGRLWLEPRMDDYAHHNLLKGAVFAALNAFGRETELGAAFVDGAMVVTPPEPGAVGREPDCGFNLYESFKSGRLRIATRTEGGSGVISGQPDLLVECLSDGSVEKDTVELRATYLEMGVGEYWILDGRGEGLTFDLLTRTDGADDWAEVAPDADGYRLSSILNRRVRIDRGTDPIGHVQWDVRLDPAA